MSLLEYMRDIKGNLGKLCDLNLRMKKLLLSSLRVSSTLQLEDALDSLVLETVENVHCDRASVFLVDKVNKELITKVATGCSE
jgi:hypothetical protein